jgi:hypothetical protein
VSRLAKPFVLGALALALLPASALAGRRHHHQPKPPPAVQQVLHDCASHNHLQRHYPVALLQQALRDMPTYTKEYSICATEIQNAISQQLGLARPAPKASAAVRHKVAQTAPNALKQAQQAGQQPVDLGGAKIAAGAIQVNGGSLLGSLPTPLLILLIVLIVIGAVPVGIRLRSIVRERRTP